MCMQKTSQISLYLADIYPEMYEIKPEKIIPKYDSDGITDWTKNEKYQKQK